MALRPAATCVLLAIVASACFDFSLASLDLGILGSSGYNIELPDSAARFEPSPLTVAVGESVLVTLVIYSNHDFVYVDLRPDRAVTLGSFVCEPAGSCPVDRL